MSGIVVDLSAVRAAAALPRRSHKLRRLLETLTARGNDAKPISDSVKNERLRLQRKDAWQAAEARVRYWKARMNMDTTQSIPFKRMACQKDTLIWSTGSATGSG